MSADSVLVSYLEESAVMEAHVLLVQSIRTSHSSDFMRSFMSVWDLIIS